MDLSTGIEMTGKANDSSGEESDEEEIFDDEEEEEMKKDSHNKTVRSQNKWFASAIFILLISATLYVVFLAEEGDGIVENYDAVNGILSDEFDSPEAQKHAEKDGNNNKKNPWENKNAFEQGKDAKNLRTERLKKWQDRNCDFSQHKEWLDAKVTKEDGPMYTVLGAMAHDSSSFTQGLTFQKGKRGQNGTLFESTGLWEKSKVRILDQFTGDVMKSVNIDSNLFGEGMTVFNNKLVQITWKSQQGFVYNATNLEQIRNFTFETTKNEGWGITYDKCQDEFIVTDGSANLHFWDPITFKEKRRISVIRMDGSPAKEMNEIEYWRGKVLSNVWFEDVLLVIDPKTGTVEKEYDFSALWPKKERKKKGADVFNGISVSDDENVLYVTGKLWNRIFKVKLEIKI